MANVEDDIIDLQTKLSFQDGLLEELNQVVTDQQKQIDRLEQRLAGFKAQMESMQQIQLMRPGDEPPPPHY